MSSYNAIWTSPCGRFGVTVADDYVRAVDWLPPDSYSGADYPADHPLAMEAMRQLGAWFENPHRGFELPLAPAPTAFQRRVREALRAIPPGETRSYGQIARWLRTAPRAIGAACRCNPTTLIVPCHRVVARNGIGGYGGDWGAGRAVDHKARLLAFEQTAAPCHGGGLSIRPCSEPDG